MGGLNSGPGPGITLLIAIVLVLTQTASSAPLYEEDEGQESNSQALAESHGCYYNFQHYNEGERILTNEPCLNCTCRNRMLMCYLRMCPFTKGIGQNCTVEKVPGQCCPIITCPEVPVQLLTSTTTEGIKAPGSHHGTKGTAVGHLDTNGCDIDGVFYPNGAQVPGSPERPCELCYCIRNKTACIMQECALHVDGCRPVYEEGQCFPVRYQCDDSPYEEEPTTTVRPPPTPGLIITTTSSEPLDCAYNNELYEDGSRIQTEDPCEHCYCLKGKIACAVQECGAPLEKEGQNCTALPPAPGKCCPDSYQCDDNTIIRAKETFSRMDKKHKFDPKHLEHNDITMASQGNQSSEGTTEAGIPSVADAGHPTDGYHPDQGTRTTEEPKHSTDRPHQLVTEGQTGKPQELDKGTENESTESHLEGLHPMKPSSASDYDQKITFPDSIKPSEVDRPEEAGTKKPESDHTTESHVIHMTNEKQPHPESESHMQEVSTKVPEHLDETDPKHPQTHSTESSQSHGQNAFDPTTNDVLNPQISSTAKDPLLDKLHNIIQDVQSQVTDGKTTEMPQEVDYQTTPQSQTGHFTDKPDILSHLPHFGSQPGNTTGEGSPEDSSNIINKLQDIIQGIYSNVADTVTPSKSPEGTTVATDTQSVPESGSKPVGESEDQHMAGKPKPEHDSESKQPELQDTKHPEGTFVPEDTKKTKPQGSIKLPQRPDSGSADKPHETEKTDDAEEESYTTENPYVTDRPDESKYPGGVTKTPFDKEKYPTGHKPFDENLAGKYPEVTKPQDQTPEKYPSVNYPGQFPQEVKPSGQHPFGTEDTPSGTEYPENVKGKPSDGQYPEGYETTGKYPEGQKYPDGSRPSTEYPSGTDVYPEGFTGRPEDLIKFPTGIKPGQHPDKTKPTGQHTEEYKPGHYPEELKPGQQYPDGSRPTGQYPEKTKPFGTEETPYGTEYPEGETERPEDYTKYPGGVKPTGHYPDKTKPTEQHAGEYKPGQYPEGYKPTGQYPEGVKPSSQYPHGEIPTGQEPENYKPDESFVPEEQTKQPEQLYPHGVKPTGQYPEHLKPGQQYPDGSKPTGQYPEKTKPFETDEGTEETPYGTEYPEGVTGKPEYQRPGNYPGGYKPSGQHPGGVRPTGQYPEEQQYPHGVKPTGQYPEKTKPFETEEGTEETPYGTEYPEGATGRPEYQRPGQYPDKFKPSGQHPEELKPGQYPHGIKPTGQYPEKTKPSETDEGTEETPYGTEYPEGATGRPEYQRPGYYPDRFKPSGQHPGGVRPTGQYPQEEQYPHGVKPTGQYPEHLKPGQQYPDGSKPYGQYPEKTKPFGTEESPYGTEYPEGVTGKPEYQGPGHYPDRYKPSGQHPAGVKPTGQYPEELKPGQYPDGMKPSGHYPEKTKPLGTEETPYGTEYPEGVTGKPEHQRPGYYPGGFKPSGEDPAGVRPTGQYPEHQYPDGSKPSEQYPEKTKPFGTEETPYGTEYPEGVTSSPEHDHSPPRLPSEDSKPSQYPEGFKPSSQHPHEGRPTGEEPEKYKPGQYPHGVRPTGEVVKPGQRYPEGSTSHYPFGAETPYGTEYPEGALGKPVGEIPSGHYPEGQRPSGLGTEETPYGTQYPESATDRPTGEYSDKTKPAGQLPEDYTYKPSSTEHYPESFKPTQEYPEGSKYPEDTGLLKKPKPSVSGDSLIATEYPESSTGKPGDFTKYPEGVRPEEHRPGQHPEKFKPSGQYPSDSKPIGHYPGQKPEDFRPTGQHPAGVRPITGQYPEKTKPFGTEKTPYGTEYPEGATGKPEYQRPGYYPDRFKPSGQHPEEQKYPHGIKPTGQYPEKTKPFGTEETPYGTEYPEDLKPGQQYPDGSKPTGQYPEKTKPFGTEETPYGTEYPEGATGRPEYQRPGQYPDRFKPSEQHPDGVRPTGHYSEELKPGQQYPDGSKPTGHYPEKTKPSETDEGTEETPYGTEYPEGATGRPEYQRPGYYPSGFKPSGQHPGGVRPTGHYPEYLKPGQQFPDGIKPTGETEEYPEGATGRPEYQKPGYYPDRFKPSGQHPGGVRPTGQYPEFLKPGQQYPDGVKPAGHYPEKTKPSETDEGTEEAPYGTEYPEGATGRPEYQKPGYYADRLKPSGQHPEEQQYPHGIKPTGQYPEKTKPFGTEETPYGTEYPEGATGRPEYQKPGHYPDRLKPSGEHPAGVKPTGQYPEHLKPGQQYPGGSKPTGHYPEKTKPSETDEGTEETPYGTEYSEGVTGRPEYQRPRPGHYPDRFKPSGQYPEKTRPSGTEDTPYSTEYPEGATGRPEEYTKYPGGVKPTGHYPDKTKPIEQHAGEYKPGQYPEKTKPLGTEETPYGTEYPEGATGRPEDYTKYPAHVKPITHYPSGVKPQEDGLSEGKPDVSNVLQETDYPGSLTDSPASRDKYPGSEQTTYEAEDSGSVTDQPSKDADKNAESENVTDYPGKPEDHSKRPGSFTPEVLHSIEEAEGVTGKPEEFRPVSDTKHPIRGKPQDPDKQAESESYSTVNPEETGVPDISTDYSEGVKPGKPSTPERPESEHDYIPGTQYPEETDEYKPEGIKHPLGSEDSPSTGKPHDSVTKHPEKTSDYPEGVTESDSSKPTSEDKYPVHPEGSKPEDESKYPVTEVGSVDESFGTEYPEGFKPTEGDKHSPSYQGKVTEKPIVGSKYPEKDSDTEYSTDQPEVDDEETGYVLGSSKRPQKPKPGDGTEYPELSGITDKPEKGVENVDFSRKPTADGVTESFGSEGVTGKPEDKTQKPDEDLTESEKHPEDAFVTHQPEKPEPPVAEDQLLETGTKPSEPAKHPENDASKPEEEFKPSFPGQTHYHPEHPEHPESPSGEGKPQEKPDYKDKHPYGSNYPGTSSTSDYPTDFVTELPVDGTKYPDKHKEGTEYPEVGKPDVFGVSGRPQDETKYPEKPTSAGHGTEYPEEVPGSQEDYTKVPDGVALTGQVTDKPHDHTKFPESFRPTGKYPEKPHDPESAYGTKYPEGITSKPEEESPGSYSEGFRPQGTEKYPHGSKPSVTDHYDPEHPQKVTELPEKSTKHPESHKPFGHLPGTDKTQEDDLESPYGTEYPEGVTDKPEDDSKYPEDVESSSGDYIKHPVGQYPEVPSETDKPHGTEDPEEVAGRPEHSTKYPEEFKPTGSKPFGQYPGIPHGTDKYPEDIKPELDEEVTSSSEYPGKPQEGLRPTGVYPGRPQDKYPEESISGTEYPEGVTSRPEHVTKYPEGFRPTGETVKPGDHIKYPTGKPHDLGTEGVTNEPEYYTEYPTGLYPGQTRRPDDKTKYPGSGPTGQFPGSTEVPVKYPGSFKPAGKPQGVNEYPEEGKPYESGATGYPEGEGYTKPDGDFTERPEYTDSLHGSDKHPEVNKFKPGFESQPDSSTEYSPEVIPTEGYSDHPQQTGKPGESTKHPDGDKPNVVYETEYPGGSTEQPEHSQHPEGSKPTKPDEQSETGAKHPVTDRPHASEDKPYGTESPVQQSGHPDETSTTKHSQRPQSEGAEVRPDVSTKLPGTEHDSLGTSHPEVGSSTVYPDRRKPEFTGVTSEPDGLEKDTESNEVTEHSGPLGTKYPEGVTNQPEEGNLYPEISKRPSKYPLKPKPGSEETGKPEDERPTEPDQPESETEEPGKYSKPGAEHSHVPSQEPHGTEDSEKPYGTEHPDGFYSTGEYPEGTKKPKPDVEHSETTEKLDETENPLEPEMGTHKRPQKPKPTGDEPFNSDYGTTEEPDVHKYPEENVHGTELPEEQKPEGAFETESPESATGKPVDHSDSLGMTKYPGYPESELSTKYPAHVTSSKPGAAYLPLDGQLPSEKIPSSEHLGEDSVPDVTDHFAPTETVFGATDRIPAGGSPPEENLLNNLHHFENHPDQPPSADLTHDHQTPSELSTTKYPDEQTTSQSGESKPVVPGTEEDSADPSATRHPSTASPGIKQPGPLRDPAGDKFPDVSGSKPEDLNKDSVTEQPHKNFEGQPEVSSEVTTVTSQEVQKTTVVDNDLINKLQSIISGIQSQVTDGKTTKLPHENYDTTSPFGRPTESSTDEFGRPSHGQVPESSTDEVSPFENEIYDQTTTYVKDVEGETTRPEFGYPLGGTRRPVGIPSKGPEGISPDEPEENLITQSPGEEESVTEKHGSSPVDSQTTDKLSESSSRPEQTEPLATGSSTRKPDEVSTESIQQDVKGDKKPTEDSEGQQPITEDALHTVTPQDPSHKHTSSSPTDTPLHVVYPTYYPEGVVTRKPGAQPVEETDKKVTVTPQSTTGDETHTVYDVQTEISSESSTSAPVVVVQEVHTEVHSERATTKPETEGYVKQTTPKPDEELTKQTEKAPQVVFGRPAITQPTGEELKPESQTHQPGGYSEREKSPNLSTILQESTTKPGLVTVTPVGFSPVTKESEHIMHLYSPKHPGSSPQYFPSTTEKGHTSGFTESQPGFVTDSGATHKPEIPGTRFPSRKTTQKPTDGPFFSGEGTTITPTQGIGEEYATKRPPFVVSTEGLPTEVTEHATTGEETPKVPQGASYVPYKLINGTKVYYPEKETSQKPSGPSQFDGYDHIPYEIINGTKFFYPNRVVTPQPAFTTTTGVPQMGMYVPYKLVNGTKVYYTQDKPKKPEKFDGLDYVPFDIVNGTKVFYPERVTTTPPPTSAMYVPFKIINDTKVYYPKDAQEEPQDIPDEYDGFDYIPYDVVDGKKIFRPDRLPGHVPVTTERPSAMYVPYKLINGKKVYYTMNAQEEPQDIPEEYDGFDYIPYDVVDGKKIFRPDRLPGHVPITTERPSAMYVPYKLINGKKVYYPKDAKTKPESLPKGYDGYDFVPYEVVNGTKVFQPERVKPEPTPALFIPYKKINGTKVYFPNYAHFKPTYAQNYDGYDYLPYEEVNGTKVFRPVTQKPEYASTPAFYPNGMFVPYKIINNQKVYYPKDAQHKPDHVPEGYDGFDPLPYELVNGTKVFHPERVTALPPVKSSMYVPFKLINGTKVYHADKAVENPDEIPDGFEGFDYLPYEEVNGTKVFRPVTQKPEYASTPAFYPNGMFVPYKIINNQKVFFPKDAQHKPRPLKPGYDGVQYLPYDVINGTKVFYPERVTTPPPVKSSMYVPFKLINGTKVYHADKAVENPDEIPDGFEGFDYVPFEIVNGNRVFYPDRVAPTMGMYVPYKKVNGTKVYYPKDSTEKEQSVPEGYDGVDYIPYEMINGTKVFYPDRATASKPPQIMYVPYKMVNGTKVYYPKDAQHKPYHIPEGYDGFDPLSYELVNGTKVFHPENASKRPVQPEHPQGMFVPYKVINGTKVYYPQEAHKRPHPLSDEYAGLDYVPYEMINGTKVFHPESVTVPAMYVPYKLINGTKVFYPKHAQHTPQQVPSEYDGVDYVPYEIVNGTQVFYPNRVPSYQGMYVPYKIVNGEKVFYPKYAQHKPSPNLEGYDGFDYLPYEDVNGTKVFRPVETVTETPIEQAMYVPYKLINGTKVFYPKHAQFKPYLIPEGYDGFDYIPYEIVNGTKVFDPEKASKPAMYVPFKVINGKKVYYPKYAQYQPHLVPEGYDGFDYVPYEIVNGTKVFDPEKAAKPAMYVPFKVINGKKVYYPKYAQYQPHLVPEGYDGFDYIPYEIVNGTKVFDPQHATAPETTYKPALYVPYKFVNGVKVYQPKFAQKEPTEVPQGYDGFDFLPYDVINGNKLFYPEQSTPVKQAMYVPYKMVNGTKVFYPKYAQYIPVQTSEGYDGFEYIPYEVVNGEKVFHPEEAIKTPFKQAMYVPFRIINGTKAYYKKHAQYDPLLIPPGYEGFDYLPYEVINGDKVFHPEQPLRHAMYVPFRVINGTKVYYPKYAQSKPELIPEGYHGFDYLPYDVINGTKVFDPKVPTKPTYLEGMYVPYKLSNNTKVFYPKDAHNKPNRVPTGYDGADYVPYELVNNTKMFYPELISTAQPNNAGSSGVYVPFKIINNKKVFYPKEATPFPPTVRHPYDGVAFVPNKAQPVSEIVYVDNEEALKVSQPGHVPGEGSCYLNNRTYANNSEIPPVSPCQTKCICVSSVVRCVRVKCAPPPENKLDCSPLYREGSCCPIYSCGDSEYGYTTTAGYGSSSGHGVDVTTPLTDFEKPQESGGVKGGMKPEEESPSGEYHLHKPPKPKPSHEALEPYDSVEGQLSPEEDYDVEDEEPYGPGTCRYAGKVYVSAQQIPRDDPCDFCFCFRSDIICLQQSCPPPIPGCRDEPIQGFCCPRYECHVKMATLLNVTSTTTTTTTTLPPHFFPHAFKGSTTRTGCFVQGRAYRVGQPIPSASGPCMDCICGGNGRMKCEPKVCTPEPMIRKMISPSENTTFPTDGR